MIRVCPQPEPADFATQVRQPGMSFLLTNPQPKGDDWKGRDFWTRTIPAMRSAYKGICAYTCHFIASDTGWSSIDHFIPKTNFPHLAYEWSNFRFVCGRLNGRKGKHVDVLDPFTIDDYWFTIDFSSMLLKPAAGLSQIDRCKVEKTIHRLRLNDDETCVEARKNWLDAYCSNSVPFHFLEKMAPFLARELVRQGLVNTIGRIRRAGRPTTSGGPTTP